MSSSSTPTSPRTPGFVSLELTPLEKTHIEQANDEKEIALFKEQESVYNFDSEEQPSEKEESKYNLLLEFIKQLKPGMDLYRISVPTFILQPVSLLEKLSIYSSPNDLMDGIDKMKVPEMRFVVVLKWILSNWRTIPRIGLEAVKPYNPVLGETFECSWIHDSDNSRSDFIAEQVSHHPPVSAFFMYNEKKQFCYYGSCAPQTHFNWNSFSTSMEGDFIVELPTFGEKYVVKHPPVSAVGALWGKKALEISDELKVVCEATGYKATLHFPSGSNNSVDGTVSDKTGVIYNIKGQVNKLVHIKSAQTKKDTVFYDVTKVKRFTKIVKPVAEQKPNESRRNWHKVTVALRKEDHEETAKQKYIVEDRERKIRAERTEMGIKWGPKLFRMEEGHWLYNNAPAQLSFNKKAAQ